MSPLQEMAASRSRRTKLKPKEEAAYFSSILKDKDGFEIKYINAFKGRGVFSCRHFEKGDFLFEYRGEILDKQEYQRRRRVYHRALEVFLFEFRFNGKQLWVDAAKEDDSLGRIANDSHKNPNSKMKTITVDRKPHLCLFAIKDISPGEEIMYNYGDSDWPWRSKISSETDPQLRLHDTAQQVISETEQQSNGFVSCEADDASEKISSETDPQLRLHDTAQQVISETEQQSNGFVSCEADDASEKISSETDPQLRLHDTAQQISSETDPQLRLHDTAQQVISETEQQSNGFVSCEADDASEKISSETDPQLRLHDTAQQVISETEQQSNGFVSCEADDASEKISSETDPQLRLHDTAQQVISETEQQSNGFVSCEADDASEKNCKHNVISSVVSTLDKCNSCSGPFSAFKWISVRCKVCSCFWHKSCYDKHVKPKPDPLTPNSEEEFSSENLSDQDYLPDSFDSSEESTVSLELEHPKQIANKQNVSSIESLGENKNARQCQENHIVTQSLLKDPVQVSDVLKTKMTGNTEEKSTEDSTRTGEIPCVQSSNVSSTVNKNNYCYICCKPQSKFARHLKIHETTNMDVARVLALPKCSKERKQMLDKLRNKGNYEHNARVLESGTGSLKLRRKPKNEYKSEDYVPCMYCHAMFLRRDLWRHIRNCLSKPEEVEVDRIEPGRTRVLSLATMSNATMCQPISQGVWKLLTVMKDDEISAAVRSDFCILQLAQSFFNRHGQDPTKYEYIRQKLREAGRLLLILQREFTIQTLEDAVRPANFNVLIQAVKKVSGFNGEKHTYQTPSLALKLGHSLQKICDIVHCRALMAEDTEMVRSTQTFKKLYSAKWAELISHTALNTLSEAHFNKPSTIPFTEDVQCLHQHLEKVADSASENLKNTQSAQAYGELSRATLAKVILFNRRRGGEVAKMKLKNFLERDTTPLHADVAAGLTKFEKKLCAHFSRVEIRGKRGRKVAVLLSPDMVDALTHLVSRRKECGVPEENVFLFGRPSCLTPYRGQDCLRIYANECGAKKPEFLRSTQLRKHVATLSQVLNLKNHELDQVADFLGHDIRVHREYYRLPEATTQLAKISKLLLAMEKGTLASLQGKTLEQIEIEDNLDFSDSEQSEDSDAETQTITEMNVDPDLGDSSQGMTGIHNHGDGKKHKKRTRREEFDQTDVDPDLGDSSQGMTGIHNHAGGKKHKKRTRREEFDQTDVDPDLGDSSQGMTGIHNHAGGKKHKKRTRREEFDQTDVDPDLGDSSQGMTGIHNHAGGKKHKKRTRREEFDQTDVDPDLGDSSQGMTGIHNHAGGKKHKKRTRREEFDQTDVDPDLGDSSQGMTGIHNHAGGKKHKKRTRREEFDQTDVDPDLGDSSQGMTGIHNHAGGKKHKKRTRREEFDQTDVDPDLGDSSQGMTGIHNHAGGKKHKKRTRREEFDQTDVDPDLGDSSQGMTGIHNHAGGKKHKKHTRREEFDQTDVDPDLGDSSQGMTGIHNHAGGKKHKKRTRREEFDQTDVDPDLGDSSQGMTGIHNHAGGKKHKKRTRREEFDQTDVDPDLGDSSQGMTGIHNHAGGKKHKKCTRREEFDQTVIFGAAKTDDARRKVKQMWSPKEISAVMKHFRNHIARGKLVSKIECEQCKTAEHPALASRSVQNIRDFVRNRGVSLKRKQVQH
ncbi:uncharacterized protein LOC120473826 isoform X4 [Pimephales promelas]|uniref:uncharacterized protein LOC120473826 isoform X4 n=1 Tax=Pimephales promelas TaxID=90988 RepID=UPI001955EE64|nr:uncharacterized protein LOC120473826 isoform X4 [Pimephales promelas]